MSFICCYDEKQTKYPCRWCGRYKNGTTKFRNKHHQMCPHCKTKLETTEDWIGGGSHYWTLKCKSCTREYTYDTYLFKLRRLKQRKERRNNIWQR